MSILDGYTRVTTIIRETEDPKDAKRLHNWIKKMDKIHGVEVSEQLRQMTLTNGTWVHKCIEDYLHGKEISDKIAPMKPLLSSIKSENTVLYPEIRLYSEKHKITGQLDLLAKVDGLITVVDWTTSIRLKKKQWLDHKFLQGGAYSMLLEENGQCTVQQLMVVVYIESMRKVQVFTDDVKVWQDNFRARLEQFKQKQKEAILC